MQKDKFFLNLFKDFTFYQDLYSFDVYNIYIYMTNTHRWWGLNP